MPRVALIHGPNLNLLGTREPEIYGRTTLTELDDAVVALGNELGLSIESFQSNHEGALIDYVQACRARVDGILINAGGLTHTSVSLRDAVAAVRDELVVLEVHLSLPAARESFRHTSLLSGVVHGRIEGFGVMSYLLALRGASALIAARGEDRDQ